jgi:site-specific DNA-adenine methylase
MTIHSPFPHNLKAPFPWFGGKRRVADIVWRHFGDVPNYVEPFAGSLAVLLCRPTAPGIETVNDADCYLANFWRALSHNPEQVASFADWPVNEADLQARHKWLIEQEAFRARMKADPDFYDPKIAGWWVWGLCSWIGSGWCRAESAQLPHLGAGQGINRKLPHLKGGRGVNRKHLGDAGRDLAGYFEQLADRLRRVRVACGDWSRVMGDSATFHNGLTGVFLDPPYASARNMTYSIDSSTVAHDVREWAIANGDNPMLRIALCGYEGEHNMPESWHVVKWKTQGGYGSQANNQGRENAAKERIWFSPHCIISTLCQQRLF